MPKKTFKWILPVLMLFFMLQFLSHLFLKWGGWRNEAGGKKTAWIKYSARLMPLDAEPIFEYGYALMREKDATQNKDTVLKSIAAFEKAIDLNVFFYMGHYYLGKALFSYDMARTHDFDRGVTAFKRAALIRGNKDSNIAADTLKLLVSQWPLLNNGDKTFCRTLLEKSITQLSAGDFNSILEVWGLYCRDSEFFKGTLKTNPQYYLHIARELSRIEINLKMRQDFLAKYEVYCLDWLKTDYQKYGPGCPDRLAQLKYLAGLAHIDGYYRLAGNTDFNEKDYLAFKKELYLDILRLLFDQETWLTDPGKRKDVSHYILAYVNESLSRMEITSFFEFLKKHNFFASQDFNAFYIKQLLHFKLADYARVIEDSEALRQSLVFVQREHLHEYTDILLLLADAFYENKLLVRSMTILEEIEKISPGLPGTSWRMLKIESLIGAVKKSEGKEIPGQAGNYRAGNYREIRESRFIEPAASVTHKTVYLVDDNKIVIGLSDKLKEMMKTGHLFQVFIDEKIYYEAYISQLKKKNNVVVQFEEHAAQCRVSVKIL